MRKIVGVVVAVAIVVAVLIAWRNSNQEDKACGSAVIGSAKQVGTITFKPDTQEVTVTGDFTAKALDDHGWHVQDTKGGGVDLKVTPHAQGNTNFRNNGQRTVVFKDGPGNPCANSVSPTGHTDYAGAGTVKVY